MLLRGTGIVVLIGLVAFTLLFIAMDGFKTTDHDYSLAQPRLTPHDLANMNKVRGYVDVLASQIGPRNRAYYPIALEQAAAYIQGRLSSFGYNVLTQPVTTNEKPSRNVWVRKRGATDDTVIIGAHYDTYGDSPGADDNTSGVALLLVLAETLAQQPTYRSIEFVFFANEEPPDYKTVRMGSVVYADQFADSGLRAVAMINLESLGVYLTGPNSQAYPFPLNLIFRSVGDFVGLAANFRSATLMQTFAADFRSASTFPLGGLVLPQWIPGVDWSDQWRFWRRGIPAIMVTDSAFYRYPYYHSPEDTADKLDYEALARILPGLANAIAKLAGKPTTS